MKSIVVALKRLVAYSWLADLLSLSAGIWFITQMVGYAHTRDSVLDEGAYLLKGWLFAIGRYHPFEWYGAWTNHMPLSFLIPGIIQRWFGPDLGVGRYFSISLAVFSLLGFWLLVYRFAGHWWATLALLGVVINPALGKMYSLAVSQGLVTCMLVWALVLVLGEDLPLWQIALGTILSAAMILTRMNMLPVLPLLVAYSFWQHGRRAGWVALLAGGVSLVIGHSIFWPNILQMWAAWIPRNLTPFLDAYRLPIGYARPWDPQIDFLGRLLSLLQSVRFHFLAVVGVLASLLLWSSKTTWKNRTHYRTAVLLATMFVILYLMHIWAALFNNYCVFCLEGYVAFFSLTGILLLVIACQGWVAKRSPAWLQIIQTLVVLVIAIGVGYGSFQEIGNWLIDRRVPGFVLTFPRFTPGQAKISRVLSVRYEMEFLEQRQLVSALAGLAAGAGLLILAGLVLWQSRRAANQKTTEVSMSAGYGTLVLSLLLVAGFILTPTIILGGGSTAYECGGDTIASYRQAGEYLAQVIPAGSLVYWYGGYSIAPLLYLPDVRLFPAQMEGDYTEYFDAEEDTLLKFGLWDREINNRWLSQADYLLIQERFYKRWSQGVETNATFRELTASPPTASCYNGARILIFERVKSSP